MIRFYVMDVPFPNLDFDTVRDWIEQVVVTSGRRLGELHYYFCSDEQLLEINRERLGHDFYTDIVTFPLDDCREVISSEFCLSLDRIAENALAYRRTYESELHRVIIHGVLHLIGYDDLTEDDRKQMREKEEECLKLLFK